jgi:hypothetical protein
LTRSTSQKSRAAVTPVQALEVVLATRLVARSILEWRLLPQMEERRPSQSQRPATTSALSNPMTSHHHAYKAKREGTGTKEACICLLHTTFEARLDVSLDHACKSPRSCLGQQQGHQSTTLTSFFYKNIYWKVIYVYSYESNFQDAKGPVA